MRSPVQVIEPHKTNSVSHSYMYMYSTGQKYINVCTVRSWYALGTLLVRSSSVVRCGVVGAVWSAYYRLCAHARSCARLSFVHVADSCDVERSPC